MIRMTLGMCAVLALLAGLAVPALGERNKSEARDQAAETIRGQVQRVDADQHLLVLKDREGHERALQIGRDARVRLNNKDSKLADLKPGDEVTIIADRLARAIHVRERDQGGHAVRGRVQSVAADQNQMVIKDREGKERTLRVNQNTRIHRGDKEEKLADLKAGDEVFVAFDQQGDTLTARAIRAHQPGHQAEFALGQIQKVAADQHQLVLKDRQGKQRTFQIGRDAKVHVGDKESKLADLKEGNEVSVAYQLQAREIRGERKNP